MNHAENRLLHSENFDLCRICLLEPESNRNISFHPIFGEDDRSVMLRQKIGELLQVKVERNDVKPKIICCHCRDSIMNWSELKRKATEAQIVINYIAKKRFGLTTLGQSTSNDTGSLSDSRNTNILTSTPQVPSYSQTRPTSSNYCDTRSVSFTSSYTGNIQQDRSNLSVNENHSTPASAHDSDDDASCHEVEVINEVISVSSDSEDDENNFKQCPTDENVIRYCSICKSRKKYNHECFMYNKEFSTCLVPNCNIVSRTIRDFDPHYRQHIGFSSREWICRCCFKENKKTERDAHGRHICRNTENVFKCYACSTVLKSMAEFAYHKFKKHNGRLINSSGNFLCFYCEKTSPDIMYIDKHMKEFHYKKNKNNQENTVECGANQEPEIPETRETTNDKIIAKKTIDLDKKTTNKVEHSYKHLLFTCIKPNCNLIFQYFPNFKFHHRQHFKTGNSVMCWQCCTPFTSVASLRVHQVKDRCRTPGMFKCYECPEVFDNLECFSVHKFTVHNGQLVIQKRGQTKTVICPSCRSAIGSSNLRGHLIHCYSYKKQNSTNSKTVLMPKKPKLVLKKSKMNSFKCGICGKVCLTAAALSSHIKVHNPNRIKKIVRNKVNSEKSDFGFVKMNQENNGTSQCVDLNINNESEVTDVVSSTSSTSKTDSQKYVDYSRFPCVNGIYSCINCPRTFNTKMGLAKHWPYCKPNKIVYTNCTDPRRILPKNYYCTDCKEYFTRVGFGTHFRITHGKKLGLNKTKRFSCTKCSFKFLYKVALLMHYQHEHGELENSINNTSRVDNSLNSVNDSDLPVVTATTSLATDYTEESMENEENCDQQIKDEIETSMPSNVGWEDNGLESFVGEQDNNLGNLKIHAELVNNCSNNDDMSNAQSKTFSLAPSEGVNDNEMEVEQCDSESALEVDNTIEVEKNIETDELGENAESHELNEVDQLEKNNEANCQEKTDNIEVTTTSNSNIDVVVVKKEFIPNGVDKSEEVNETQNVNIVVNNSNLVNQKDNLLNNSKEENIGTNGLNGN